MLRLAFAGHQYFSIKTLSMLRKIDKKHNGCYTSNNCCYNE